MDSFDIRNWYWQVAGNANVFSTGTGGYVPPTALQYAAWVARGNVTPVVATEAELLQYLAERAPDIVITTPAGLAAYAATVRYNKETAGIVVGGTAVATDRQSQAMIAGAYNMASLNSAFTTQWKTDSGAFIQLNAPAIIAIATAVGTHVAACFSTEATVGAGITAGAIKSQADVDTAFAAVTV